MDYEKFHSFHFLSWWSVLGTNTNNYLLNLYEVIFPRCSLAMESISIGMPFILALFRERSTLMPKLDGKESNENLIHLREILEAQLSYSSLVSKGIQNQHINNNSLYDNNSNK
ncbi:hypothetical protein H8356DRAFT_1325665 [Neocallimastix lanati (nom. inval.)]|nr:hypothetical protein H8356DRAFT_1325665 [Neocallimastix sp. JGI-2020a]